MGIGFRISTVDSPSQPLPRPAQRIPWNVLCSEDPACFSRCIITLPPENRGFAGPRQSSPQPRAREFSCLPLIVAPIMRLPLVALGQLGQLCRRSRPSASASGCTPLPGSLEGGRGSDLRVDGQRSLECLPVPLLTLLAQDWLRRVVQVKTVIRTGAQHVVATPLCDTGRLVSIADSQTSSRGGCFMQ